LRILLIDDVFTPGTTEAKATPARPLEGLRILLIDDVFTPGTTEAKATPARPLEGLRILLIDDVFTTGATVNECAKALVEAGAAEVRVLAAARV